MNEQKRVKRVNNKPGDVSMENVYVTPIHTKRVQAALPSQLFLDRLHSHSHLLATVLYAVPCLGLRFHFSA